MKYLTVLFLIFLGVNISYANDYEEVRLQSYDIKTLNTPKLNYEKVYSLEESDEDEFSGFNDDEEVFESKAGKAFTKFVNDKVINNKINTFTDKLSN
jgi:hypothetical protein